MNPIPRWIKVKKQRVCRECGGTKLDDIGRKRAVFWCSACCRLWNVSRNQYGDLRVRYFSSEGDK
jgi:hypothetical protein